MRERPFLALVALTAAVGPVGLQIYLPCLPAVRDTFGASLAATQWTLSLPMLLLAPALLVYGPAADRLGRRPVLLAGLALFALGTLGCLLAPSLGWLIAARVVQTIGGAAGIVLGRAMLSDRYAGTELAGKIATVTMATVVLPTISPLVGGVVSESWGWRAVFAVLLVASLPLLTFALRGIHDPPSRVRATPAAVPSVRTLLGLELLRGRPVLSGLVLQCAFSQAVFMAFVAAAPHIMVDELDRPASEYGLFFVLIASSFVAGNFSATRLLRPGHAIDHVRRGAALALAGVLLLTTLMALQLQSPWALFGPMIVVVFANGLSNPHAQSLALAQAPGSAATAAGLIAFSQQVAGAGLIQIGALGSGNPGLHLAIALLTSSTLALLGVQFAARRPAAAPGALRPRRETSGGGP